LARRGARLGAIVVDRTDHGLPTLPALDGIRAVAVAGVLLYHSDIFWFPGGLLGVEVFFVLSGYLITSLLWSELRRTQAINVLDFWRRRARRLFPALFVMLAVVATVWVLALPDEVARVRGDVAAAATYTSNWYLIHSDHSYFISFARPSPFAHLWSLAIEEQFYLLWPPALLILWRFVRSRTRIATAIVAGAGASAVALSLLYSGGDPSRIYYGTDTRACGLLIGSALALMWRPFAPGEERAVPPWALDVATVGAGGLLVWSFMRFDDLDAFTYRPGLLLVALATAALIAACVHPAARVARVLATRPMRWLGKRSYSVYLWYFPVFVLTRPGVDFDIGIGPAFAIRTAITLTLAALSYRFVEEPIRNGALGRIRRRISERMNAAHPFGQRWAFQFAAVTTIAVLFVSQLSLAMARAPAHRLPGEDALSAGVLGRPEDIDLFAISAGEIPPPIALGDSVMSGARNALRNEFGRIRIDARVGRQVSEGIQRLDLYRRRGQLGDVVVIHLGDNGRFLSKQFDQIMRVLDGVRRVVFVNAKVARRWERTVNSTILAGAHRYPGVKLVDWHHLWRHCRAGRVFGPDAIHLTEYGARCYAHFIADAAL
jgi:peptidoglycan/LPS O-acetylase OafA/YrhL